MPLHQRVQTQSFRSPTGSAGVGRKLITPTRVCSPFSSCLTSSHKTDAWRSGRTSEASMDNCFAGSRLRVRIELVALSSKICSLNRRLAAFFGSNTNRFLDRYNKDFSVPDFAGASRLDDRLNSLLNAIVRHNDLKFYLRQKIDCVLASSIDFRVALLPAESFHFTYGHSLDPDLRQGLLYVLHLKGFNDRLDFLHIWQSLSQQPLKRKETERESAGSVVS